MTTLKLTRQDLLNLPAGEYRFYIRLTRLFDPEPVTFWQGAAPIVVERIYEPHRRNPERITLIAVVDGNGIPDWAEYDPDDIQPDGNLICEDYMMELFGLAETKNLMPGAA